jgi:hypothetical protein
MREREKNLLSRARTKEPPIVGGSSACAPTDACGRAKLLPERTGRGQTGARWPEPRWRKCRVMGWRRRIRTGCHLLGFATDDRIMTVEHVVLLAGGMQLMAKTAGEIAYSVQTSAVHALDWPAVGRQSSGGGREAAVDPTASANGPAVAARRLFSRRTANAIATVSPHVGLGPPYSG